MIIYEIVCNQTGERYIGSTKLKLNKRMWGHRRKSNTTISKQIIIRGDYQVNIIEDGDFGKEREQYYIETLPNINRINACGFDKERERKRKREASKNPENKMRNRERKQKWRENNKDKSRQYDRNYKAYQRTWGGDCRTHNNLLLISLDLFE